MRARGWVERAQRLTTPAEAPGRLDRRWMQAVALALAALFGLQLYLHALRTSPVVDEPVHLLAGYRHLACGDYAFNPEHPPLLKQVAALPLQWMHVTPPALPCDTGFTSKPVTFALGNEFLIANAIERIVLPARLAACLFSLLLAWLLYRAGNRMLGAWGGAIAVGMLALEPTLIAHGSLVTTDMIITAATMAAVMTMFRARESRPATAILSMGLAIGFMLAAKHSAIVILPGLFLTFLLDAFCNRKTQGSARPALKSAAQLAMASLLALLVLWAFYEFRYAAAPGQAQDIDLAEHLARLGPAGIADGFSGRVLLALGGLRVFPESYLLGVADIIATGDRPSRILGHAYPTGQWFYFPVALSVKTSIPLLLLAPIGALSLFRQPGKRRALLYLAVPPALYFLACMTSGINIGIRHVLPVYPFLIMLAVAGAQALWRRGRAWKAGLCVLFAYQLVTVARISPDYIPFANDLWGGSDRTHLLLSDSNVEWGQSVKRVGDYVREQHVDRCWFVGVGSPRLHSREQPCALLPDGYRWLVLDAVQPPVPRVVEGTVFLGVRMLPPRGGPEYLPLLDTGRPTMLAGSILVFKGRFDLPLVAALSHARRADALVAAGQYAAAVEDARQGVALGPEDPRTRISLAAALAAHGQREAALAELAHAGRLIRQQPKVYGFVQTRLEAAYARALASR